jgi:hypothetical protein
MGNLTQNRLNVTLDNAAVTTIKTSIAAIAEQLPAGSLTDDERGKFRAIDVDNKIFVEDTLIEMAISGSGIIPPFLNSAFIQTDLTLFEQLDAIESNLTNVLRTVIDLKRICGSESYDYSLAVYRIYEAANLAGIPGAKESYEKLKVRFEKSNGGGSRPVAEDL